MGTKLADARQVYRDLRHAVEHIEQSCKKCPHNDCKVHIDLARGILRSAIAREVKSKRKSDEHNSTVGI